MIEVAVLFKKSANCNRDCEIRKQCLLNRCTFTYILLLRCRALEKYKPPSLSRLQLQQVLFQLHTSSKLRTMMRHRKRLLSPPVQSDANSVDRNMLSCSCSWLKRMVGCRATEYCFIFSMMLNIYFLLTSNSTEIIHYDNIDHRNSADSIRYSQCRFEGQPMIIKEVEWDTVSHIHSSCLCGIVHII